jgi:hypothetical protein
MMIKHLGRGAFRKGLMATRKSAGGYSCNQEFFALKFVAKQHQENVKLEVFCQADGHPYLLQLVSFFETKVCSSYINVSVFRQLLILKFTMTINM